MLTDMLAIVQNVSNTTVLVAKTCWKLKTKY